MNAKTARRILTAEADEIGYFITDSGDFIEIHSSSYSIYVRPTALCATVTDLESVPSRVIELLQAAFPGIQFRETPRE